MKKLLALMLLLSCLLVLCSCEPAFEYDGKQIASVVYYVSEAWGSHQCIFKVDMLENKASCFLYDHMIREALESETSYDDDYFKSVLSSNAYDAYMSIGGFEMNGQWVDVKSFSEEEEKRFIDSCYSGGLFNLRKKYRRIIELSEFGMDWSVTITYTDGSVKRSWGYMRTPDITFALCRDAFYEMFGLDVLYNVL